MREAGHAGGVRGVVDLEHLMAASWFLCAPNCGVQKDSSERPHWGHRTPSTPPLGREVALGSKYRSGSRPSDSRVGIFGLASLFLFYLVIPEGTRGLWRVPGKKVSGQPPQS